MIVSICARDGGGIRVARKAAKRRMARLHLWR